MSCEHNRFLFISTQFISFIFFCLTRFSRQESTPLLHTGWYNYEWYDLREIFNAKQSFNPKRCIVIFCSTWEELTTGAFGKNITFEITRLTFSDHESKLHSYHAFVKKMTKSRRKPLATSTPYKRNNLLFRDILSQ